VARLSQNATLPGPHRNRTVYSDRERAAEGAPVTGADLDRQFGTRDYGRKVLRQLAAEPQPTSAGQP
jgi:hypothetical protein